MTNPDFPPGHRLVETEDGTSTLFSERFQEACHSTSGARTETLLHYFNGCEISEKLAQGNLQILEIGFGLGIGFLTTFDEIQKLQSSASWKYLSVELDKKLLEWFRLQHQSHSFLKDLQWEGDLLKCKDHQCELIIISGDARETLPRFLKSNSQRFSAIYQDAFSPKKNPLLWTKEWFELLKKYSSESVIMSTYSSSTSIRKSMLEAGWVLYEGEKFGPKKSSTRARLTGTTSEAIIERLNRSPAESLKDS
jgi:tRNA U34 5-methylaminomethyl-2-thiouridine-forming methyltransferase MnmC